MVGAWKGWGGESRTRGMTSETRRWTGGMEEMIMGQMLVLRWFVLVPLLLLLLLLLLVLLLLLLLLPRPSTHPPCEYRLKTYRREHGRCPSRSLDQ